jgi:hypothetical protein
MNEPSSASQIVSSGAEGSFGLTTTVGGTQAFHSLTTSSSPANNADRPVFLTLPKSLVSARIPAQSSIRLVLDEGKTFATVARITCPAARKSQTSPTRYSNTTAAADVNVTVWLDVVVRPLLGLPQQPGCIRRSRRHSGQRFGGRNPFDLRNSCSPIEKRNSASQSLQTRVRSPDSLPATAARRRLSCSTLMTHPLPDDRRPRAISPRGDARVS